MRMHMSLRYATACLLIGGGLAAAADAQYIYPYLGGPGAWAYRGVYPYDGFYGYNPDTYYYHYSMPRPPVGGYLPHRPVAPPSPYAVPPTGVVPQPYPYDYQPPLYTPPLYSWPYYPTRPAPPYYYYRRPFLYPWLFRRPSRQYGAAPRARQNVAPVGSENLPDG